MSELRTQRPALRWTMSMLRVIPTETPFSSSLSGQGCQEAQILVEKKKTLHNYNEILDGKNKSKFLEPWMLSLPVAGRRTWKSSQGVAHEPPLHRDWEFARKTNGEGVPGGSSVCKSMNAWACTVRQRMKCPLVPWVSVRGGGCQQERICLQVRPG